MRRAALTVARLAARFAEIERDIIREQTRERGVRGKGT